MFNFYHVIDQNNNNCTTDYTNSRSGRFWVPTLYEEVRHKNKYCRYREMLKITFERNIIISTRSLSTCSSLMFNPASLASVGYYQQFVTCQGYLNNESHSLSLSLSPYLMSRYTDQSKLPTVHHVTHSTSARAPAVYLNLKNVIPSPRRTIGPHCILFIIKPCPDHVTPGKEVKSATH